MKLLLAQGANPDVQDGDGDAYPVHWVMSPEVASVLVEAGANLRMRNRLGERAEETAKRMNRPEVEEVYRDGGLVPRMGWVPVAKPRRGTVSQTPQSDGSRRMSSLRDDDDDEAGEDVTEGSKRSQP